MFDLSLAVPEVKSKVEKLYPENKVVGVFLVGSVAMHMFNSTSDIDAIAVVLPSLHNLFENTLLSDHHKDQDLTVVDVRKFFQMMQKQNPAVLNAVNTHYYWIEDGYDFLVDDFWRGYDVFRCCMAKFFQMMQKQNPAVLNAVNTHYYWIEDGYDFLVDDFWRGYDVFRCCMATLAMARNDLKRFAQTENVEKQCKLLARVWFNLDQVQYMLDKNEYPAPPMLAHYGDYLKLKNGLHEYAKNTEQVYNEFCTMTEQLQNVVLAKKQELACASAVEKDYFTFLLEEQFFKMSQNH